MLFALPLALLGGVSLNVHPLESGTLTCDGTLSVAGDITSSLANTSLSAVAAGLEVGDARIAALEAAVAAGLEVRDARIAALEAAVAALNASNANLAAQLAALHSPGLPSAWNNYLLAHFDASDSASVDTVAGTWTSIGGSLGTIVLESSGPTFSVGPVQNGLATISLPTDRMLVMRSPVSTVYLPFTVIYAMRLKTCNYPMMFGHGATSDSSIEAHADHTGSTGNVIDLAGGSANDLRATGSNLGACDGVPRVVGFAAPSSGWHNGRAFSSETMTSVGGTGSSRTPGTALLGSAFQLCPGGPSTHTPAAQFTTDCDVLEVLFWNTDLSQAAGDAVVGYLKEKWAIA